MSIVALSLSTIDNLLKTFHGYYMDRGDLFQNTYRIHSTRYPNYDYSEDAAYFITICTRDRVPWFGKICNRIMGLSEIGCIVANEWQKTALIRNNVILDYWILMPDHFHAILIINNNLPVETSPLGRLHQTTNPDTRRLGIGNELIVSQHTGNYNVEKRLPRLETPQRGVSTADDEILITWKSGCLGSVVNQFKGACTKRIRDIVPEFTWQPRFYDRIIRNDNEMNEIRDYIITNPNNTNS